MIHPRILVVYYSRTGHTRRVAEEIAGALSADIDEIVDEQQRGGVWGYLRAGYDAACALETAIKAMRRDPANYDLVIVGSPIWASSLTPAARTYLTRFRGRIPRAAFFVTCGGSGQKRVFRQMHELFGRVPVAALAVRERDLNGPAASRLIGDFVKGVRQAPVGGPPVEVTGVKSSQPDGPR